MLNELSAHSVLNSDVRHGCTRRHADVLAYWVRPKSIDQNKYCRLPPRRYLRVAKGTHHSFTRGFKDFDDLGILTGYPGPPQRSARQPFSFAHASLRAKDLSADIVEIAITPRLRAESRCLFEYELFHARNLSWLSHGGTPVYDSGSTGLRSYD